MLRQLLCLILVSGTVCPLPAFAEPGGIRFDEMPVGCRIHGRYSTGEEVVDVYMGQSGGRHVIKTYRDPEGALLIRTTLYSADGLMLHKTWADGKWESFSPAACLPVPGACRYTYRNADGQSFQYIGENTVAGDVTTSRGGWVGQAPFSPNISTRGRYNIQIAYREGDLSFQVTRFEACDDKLSS